MSSTLMVSVSGVRGLVGQDLTPELVARYAAAFGALVGDAGRAPVVVVGRDARTSGVMFAAAVQAGLQSVGATVIDCGVVPTPTVQLAVEHHGAGGGVVITASHNPIEWNALKFIGADGIFLDAERGARLSELVASGRLARAGWNGIGSFMLDQQAVARHVDGVRGLPYLTLETIRRRRFTVALDCVRGAGGTIMPAVLEALGCRVAGINLETDGRFPRPPEPVPEHLDELSALVRQSGADVGMAVDPDVDRLALVDEQGTPIGEDYTLAFAVRAVLGASGAGATGAQRASGGGRRGNQTTVVCNLSTSLVVEDAARDFGAAIVRTPVGEANVARAIMETGAEIGGEGNGGVMLPALHVGRDAPVAAALVLELLARSAKPVSALVASSPRYAIVKSKVPRGAELRRVYGAIEQRLAGATVDRTDGMRLAWPDRWLHVRPSGTEPIVRLIAEAPTEALARELVAAGAGALEIEGAGRIGPQA
ncbi:MAG: phosphoglucosamine mutase [Gemmatimonadetes bacterium]|nr:phosphoglucosamine mutase [Gemmatimonadota bacterium]